MPTAIFAISTKCPRNLRAVLFFCCVFAFVVVSVSSSPDLCQALSSPFVVVAVSSAPDLCQALNSPLLLLLRFLQPQTSAKPWAHLSLLLWLLQPPDLLSQRPHSGVVVVVTP